MNARCGELEAAKFSLGGRWRLREGEGRRGHWREEPRKEQGVG